MTTGDPYAEGTFSVADWKRVGQRIRERIPEIGINKSMVREREGPTIQPLNDYIAGKRFSREMAVKLCKALDWTTDSIVRILEGGDPVDQNWPHSDTDDLAGEVRKLRTELDELRREIRSTSSDPEQ
jgi:hypothetical protein